MVSILGANSASGGYEISNSLRFNDGDSPGLGITPSGAGNRKTWTYSGWVKRSALTTGQEHIFMVNGGNNDSTWVQLRFEDNDFTFSFYNQRAIRTDRKFRDPSAWYHIVVAVDTTQGTDSNRIKLYVNGVQETSFSDTNYPSQNDDTGVNGTYRHFIGGEGGTSGNASGSFYDGYMTEVHLVDGSQLLPTSFGEFNDNGVWIPKKYSGSYGTNGFFLQFKQTGTSQNSSGIGADTSGNDNHFAVTNLAATDVTTDTPTNNYATMNPLDHSGFTFSEGNLKVVTPSGDGSCRATIAMPSGKWYWEVLYLATTSGNIGEFGILATDSYPITQSINQFSSGGYSYLADGNKSGDGSVSSYGASYTTGDIIGVAFDADNGILAFYKNGSSQGNAFTGKTDKLYAPAISDPNGGQAATDVANFGQEGSFAGNKTAQGNSDANGYGDFYYSVPSGYYALNTKNLAEFG